MGSTITHRTCSSFISFTPSDFVSTLQLHAKSAWGFISERLVSASSSFLPAGSPLRAQRHQRRLLLRALRCNQRPERTALFPQQLPRRPNLTHPSVRGSCNQDWGAAIEYRNEVTPTYRTHMHRCYSSKSSPHGWGRFVCCCILLKSS